MSTRKLRVNKHLANGQNVIDTDEFIQDFRGLLWNSVVEFGLTWQQLAEKANLHVSTIENFLFGKTKRPQFPTMLRLLEAMGFRIGVFKIDAPPQQDELSFRGTNGKTPSRGRGRRKALEYYATK